MPFDAERLELRGEPVAVIRGLRNTEFGLADDGTLIYVSGGAFRSARWCGSIGRDGKNRSKRRRRYVIHRMSPDGTRVALDVNGPPDRDIWIWICQQDSPGVSPSASSARPRWSRRGACDGRQSRVLASDHGFGVTNMFMQASDLEASAPERLLVAITCRCR